MPNQAVMWLGATQVNPDTTGFQGQQQVAGLSNGNILVVYSDDSPVAPSAGRDVVGVIYNAAGEIVVPAFQLNVNFFSDNERAPSIAATNDGGFYVVYEDSNASGVSLRVERYSAAGTHTGGTTVLSDPGAQVLNSPVIAVNSADNSFIVTYEYHDGADDQIRSRAFDGNMNFVVQRILATDEDPTNTQFDGDPSRQDTAALQNGGYVTVFDEGDIFNGANEQTVEFRLTRPNGTRGIQVEVSADDGFDATQACVAVLSDGAFVVVWREDSHSDLFGDMSAVRARIYEQDGTARTDVLSVLESASTGLANPDVTGLADGTFVVALHDNTSGHLLLRTFDNDGTSAPDFTFGSTTNSPQGVDLGTTTDGRILLTWQSFSPGNDVQFAIFDSRDGAVITAQPGQGQVTAHPDGSTVIGTTGVEAMYGSGGADLFQFIDTVIPAGVDTIDGGAGTDTFEITALTGQSLVSLDLHQLMTGEILDGTPLYGTKIAQLDGIENVIVRGQQDVFGSFLSNHLTATGNFANDLYGSDGSDTLEGGEGNDTLDGGNNNDTMDGGTGSDSMTGGSGNDTYYIDTRGDAVVETGGLGGGTDTVIASYSATLVADAENLTLSGTRNTDGTGNAADNVVTGNTGRNVLHGLSGNDTLDGGEGDDELRGLDGQDSMTGGLGNDDYFVDDVGDATVEEGSGLTGGIDTTFSTISTVLGANIENLRLQGTGDIDGTGNEWNNKIYGTDGINLLVGAAGNDTIDAKDGEDTLAGGQGNDTLTSGGGADIIQVDSVDAGVDTVTDFSRNFDRFDLGGGSFTAVSIAPNGDAVLTHAGGAIRVQTPPNLTLAEWNALVLPAPLAAGGPILFEDGTDAGVFGGSARLAGSHGDWVFA